ncbi:uncharacterized protein LOC100846910 [Brachypodium distachyon]|uniref:Uncharacterized protein n=1 Tax=Brachypodium distachyon TaxID=15368 RepID=A0A0Q3GID7_BRADI|nr:uncharacterized protein LOC100846910 [Brachypodium distachyon]KQK10871.1 hypothetical protein BRADI_2g56730v3 [Brachypodium distachyon]|eukprot:XP_003567328.1 uncharacterized protein LOC100846910 [Brachypodium distachyon]
MNVYHNLASSPPAPVPAGEQPARTAPAGTAAEEGKWEGMAVAGAATLARNFSSASQRFAAVERSKSTNGGHRGGGSGGGFQAAVRRAFSMRRQPGSGISDGYWRIHDGMDEDADDADEAEQQVLEEAGEQQQKEKNREATERVAEGDAASNSKETEITGRKKNKKKGRILKACKKLLGF